MDRLIQIEERGLLQEGAAAVPHPLKIGWISLGCPKNLVDSEGMLGDLSASGYQFTADLDEADAVVVNTCGFIEEARDESIAALREAVGLNRAGARRRVIATGCLAQRYGETLLQEVEGLDGVVGMGQQGSLGAVLARSFGPGRSQPQMRRFDPAHYFPAADRRSRLTPPWSAYVKISDGCDNPCTFCSIPIMRGKMRSRPADDIEQDVRFLADSGVQEIILIAQDSTHYGMDLGKEDTAALLKRLAQIEGPRWIRLMYAYPTRVNERLMEVIAREDRICKYIDMPLQHASDPVLAAMKRPGTSASYLRLLQRLRAAIPQITIRTTMILGFPGETEDDFRRLLDFVEQARFDRLGAFRYSPEPGTPGAEFTQTVSAKTVNRRYDQLMRLQQQISLDRNREWVGRTLPALVESMRPDGSLVCRSERDAPDIDGNVFVEGPGMESLRPGSFLNVRITRAEPYDLFGTPAEVAPAQESAKTMVMERLCPRR